VKSLPHVVRLTALTRSSDPTLKTQLAQPLYADFRAARRRAHGVRRKQLGANIQLQSQQVVRAKADTVASCARNALTGYPWE
jgi:hypothetical protein